MTPGKTAVLLMAYGSPPSLTDDDVRAYLDHILQFYRGAAATDEAVKNLRARYEAIGGSPLYTITERIVERAQELLDAAAPGAYQVRLAMKHSPPFVEDVTWMIAQEGFDRGIGIALAPFRSRLSTEGYFRLVADTNAELSAPVEWSFVEDWHLHPKFLELWSSLIDEALEQLGHIPTVLLSTHSLPARIGAWNDPYPTQFEVTAEALAKRSNLERWRTAYQSAAAGDDHWLGPSVPDVLSEFAGKGERKFLIAPIGFLADHLEILYDLDIAAQKEADKLGVQLARTQMPNDDPKLISLLSDVVQTAASAAATSEKPD